MDLVVLCCLGPTNGRNPQELGQIAKGAFSQGQHATFGKMGIAMAAYRCGRFQEAVDALPEGGFSNPRDELVTLVFRAMIQHHLGPPDQARRWLQIARRKIRETLEGPDGPPLLYQDTPVVWCQVQTALREAEALIEPVEQESQG